MKLLLADQHSIVREGISKIVMHAYPFVSISEADKTTELLLSCSNENYDLIITEINWPSGNSIMDVIKEIRESCPRTQVIVLSSFPAEQYAVRAIKAGCSAYLTKDIECQEFIEAITRVMAGKKYITQQLAELMVETVTNSHKTQLKKLSDRELEVLRLLSQGYTVSDIANSLQLCKNTISAFRSRMLEKMDFHNNTELIRFAVANQL